MTETSYGQCYKNSGYNQTVHCLIGCGAQRDLAEEIAQAAWVRGWERLPQLRNDRCVVAWVNRIARNLLNSKMRRKREVPLLPHHERSAVTSIDSSRVHLEMILQKCTPNERLVLEASMAGYSGAELAQKFSKSVSSIQSELWRARRAAGERVKRKEGHTDDRNEKYDEYRRSRKTAKASPSRTTPGVPEGDGGIRGEDRGSRQTGNCAA